MKRAVRQTMLIQRLFIKISICVFGLGLFLALPMSSNSSPPVVEEQPCEEGLASYYGRRFHGRLTANGERYDMHAMTAAHRNLEFGCSVEVVNLENGRKVRVRINDRGPFVKGRVIDLSYAAAKEIGMLSQGVVKVKVSKVPSKPPVHPVSGPAGK